MQLTHSITISEAEWQVMRVVWANNSVTSREVINVLAEKMKWKESTIKTLIGRLVSKELLNTKREGRKFIYTTNVDEDLVIKDYSLDVLNRVCDKQEGEVVKHLVNKSNLNRSDIKELIKVLENKLVDAPEEIACQCIPGQCNC